MRRTKLKTGVAALVLMGTSLFARSPRVRRRYDPIGLILTECRARRKNSRIRKAIRASYRSDVMGQLTANRPAVPCGNRVAITLLTAPPYQPPIPGSFFVEFLHNYRLAVSFPN